MTATVTNVPHTTTSKTRQANHETVLLLVVVLFFWLEGDAAAAAIVVIVVAVAAIRVDGSTNMLVLLLLVLLLVLLGKTVLCFSRSLHNARRCPRLSLSFLLVGGKIHFGLEQLHLYLPSFPQHKILPQAVALRVY